MSCLVLSCLVSARLGAPQRDERKAGRAGAARPWQSVCQLASALTRALVSAANKRPTREWQQDPSADRRDKICKQLAASRRAEESCQCARAAAEFQLSRRRRLAGQALERLRCCSSSSAPALGGRVEPLSACDRRRRQSVVSPNKSVHSRVWACERDGQNSALWRSVRLRASSRKVQVSKPRESPAAGCARFRRSVHQQPPVLSSRVF